MLRHLTRPTGTATATATVAAAIHRATHGACSSSPYRISQRLLLHTQLSSCTGSILSRPHSPSWCSLVASYSAAAVFSSSNPHPSRWSRHLQRPLHTRPIILSANDTSSSSATTTTTAASAPPHTTQPINSSRPESATTAVTHEDEANKNDGSTEPDLADTDINPVNSSSDAATTPTLPLSASVAPQRSSQSPPSALVLDHSPRPKRRFDPAEEAILKQALADGITYHKSHAVEHARLAAQFSHRQPCQPNSILGWFITHRKESPVSPIYRTFDPAEEDILKQSLINGITHLKSHRAKHEQLATQFSQRQPCRPRQIQQWFAKQGTRLLSDTPPPPEPQPPPPPSEPTSSVPPPSPDLPLKENPFHWYTVPPLADLPKVPRPPYYIGKTKSVVQGTLTDPDPVATTQSDAPKKKSMGVGIRVWTLANEMELCYIVHTHVTSAIVPHAPELAAGDWPAEIPMAEWLVWFQEEQHLARLEAEWQTLRAAGATTYPRPKPIQQLRRDLEALRGINWNPRFTVVMEFSRRMRQSLMQANLYPRKTIFEGWFSHAEQLARYRTEDHSFMHWDLMSDPRSRYKPRAGLPLPRAFKSQGQPDALVTADDEGSAVMTLRQVLHYIFVHRLPRGEGSPLDVIRQVELLANNSEEIHLFRVQHSVRLPELLDDDGDPITDDAVATIDTTDDPTQLPLIATITDLPTLPAPGRYTLPLTLAQGRGQGFTWERSVRATLSQFPEFKVVRKTRSHKFNPGIGQQRRRANTVYGLDLQLVKQSMNQVETKRLKRLEQQKQASIEKVATLRNFTPEELELVTRGLEEFHSHHFKWSEIARKYLPAWPRHLLAQAWTRHQHQLNGPPLKYFDWDQQDRAPVKRGLELLERGDLTYPEIASQLSTLYGVELSEFAVKGKLLREKAKMASTTATVTPPPASTTTKDISQEPTTLDSEVRLSKDVTAPSA